MNNTTQKRDYYEVLEVSREATEQEIKKAYRTKAHEYHPDRNQGDPDAEFKFKEVAEAYEVLRDSSRREQYDRFGHAGSSMGVGINIDPMEIFNSFFGEGFFGGGHASPRKGHDRLVSVNITLETVLSGATVPISVKRAKCCDKCAGLGGEGSSCDYCGGYGKIRQQSSFMRVVSTCPKCFGEGVRVHTQCNKCAGHKYLSEIKKIEIKIPPGVNHGSRLKITEQGDLTSLSLPRGDLICEIHVEKHSVFERHRNDLFCVANVNFVQACLGDTIKIPTLDGEDIDLTVPAGTQFDSIFTISKRGLPVFNRPNSRGNQVVQVKIEVPKNLSEEQKGLLKRFNKKPGTKSKKK